MPADRNLLFGMLALHTGFVARDQLLEGLNAWMLRKQTPLSELLRQQGVLTDDDLRLLDGLVERHVGKHGDVQKSLASLRVEPEVRHSLAQLEDAGVQASLASVWPETTSPDREESAIPETGGTPPAQEVSEILPTDGTPVPMPAGGWVRYRLLRPHAKGGLGEVSVALDLELQREVALKQIQGRFADDNDSRNRFVREAEITGNLEHPGIVPVYGLLTPPDGRPIYAMRFIRGESLHDKIARFHQADKQPQRDPGERSLALRDLLTRFVVVCNAVGYAHSRGVIHRDLKPANVMLGDFGETLVVDWGLAKMLDLSDPARTTQQPLRLSHADTVPTVLGEVMGTPHFMPPEQARDEHDRMGPHSDTWALGATLYALLTGQSPYRGADVLAQAARNNFPALRQVNALVPAALEAVCLKAMAQEPEGRYATARQLAADVEHWLADEPVDAYREPVVERVRRWGRRHRSVVTAGVALLLTSVVGLGLGLWAVNAQKAETQEALEQARINLDRAKTAEEEANANLTRAEKNLKLAKDAVNQCFNVVKTEQLFQGPRMEKARKMLLVKTLPFYREFQESRPGDRELQHEGAMQWFNVAYIEAELGNRSGARQAYEEAQQQLLQLAQAHPDVPVYQADLANTHNNLGNQLADLGRSEEALKQYHQAQQLFSKLTQAHPNVPLPHQRLAVTHNNLGLVLYQQGRSEEALKHHDLARKLQSKLVQAHPDVARHQQDLATTHNNLGKLLSEQGRSEEALKQYHQSQQLWGKLTQAHPDVPVYQQGLAATHFNLGVLLPALGRSEEALKHYYQSQQLRGQVAQTHPDVPAYQRELASTVYNLGSLLSNLGRSEEALKQYHQAQQLFSKLTQAHPDDPLSQEGLAGTHYNLGKLLSDLGQREEALKQYDQAQKLRSKLAHSRPDVPDYQSDLASTHNNLGLLLRALGRSEEALKQYDQAQQLRSKLTQAHPDVPSYQVDLAGTHCNLGHLLRDLGKPAESLPHYEQAITKLQTVRKQIPADPTARRFLGNSHSGRARALVQLNRPGEAVADWDEVIALEAGPFRAFFRLRGADSRARSGDYRRAAAEADELAQPKSLPAEAAYHLACIHALNATSAGRDPARPLAERTKLAEQYARQAMTLLRRAAVAGHFHDPAHRAHLDKDDDLDVLRDRADYADFVATLPAVPPAAPAKRGAAK